MRGEAILGLLIASTIVVSGCYYPGGGYSIYEYSGINYIRVYHGIHIEEVKLLEQFLERNDTFNITYSHGTNSFGLGSYDFSIIDQETNGTIPGASVSIDINDAELAPGGSYGLHNIFVTNVTISLVIITQRDTTGMESRDIEEANRLSSEIFEKEKEEHEDITDLFERSLGSIFDTNPNHSYLGRNYSILCVD